MRVISSPKTIQSLVLKAKRSKKTVAVVPTMGYLHEGHLTLLRKARKKADLLILTLFVNPTQFGPNEDLSRYPRDEKGDLAKAKSCKVDFVFMPKPKDMYPEGHQTSVDVTEASRNLCGASRPGHFKGVTTVVAKLFNITQPDFAFFGLKDFQQFAVLSRMVKDLNMPVRMIGVPTVREKDGLALSSRNVYLSPEERSQALSLSRGLASVAEAVKKGKTNIDELLSSLKSSIQSQPLARIDYAECMDAETLQPLPAYRKNKTLFALAVFFGKTRLIDNRVV